MQPCSVTVASVMMKTELQDCTRRLKNKSRCYTIGVRTKELKLGAVVAIGETVILLTLSLHRY